MPILLNQLEENLKNAANTTIVNKYFPKFFDKRLTGSGGQTTGLLTMKNSPCATPKARITETSYYTSNKKSVFHNGNTTVYHFPINPVAPSLWDYMDTWKHPDLSMCPVIAKKSKSELYLELKVTELTLEETITTDYYTGVTSKTVVFVPAYQMMFYNIVDPNTDTCRRAYDYSGMARSAVNMFKSVFTTNPVSDWNDILTNISSAGYKVDIQAFNMYMMNYDIYDAVSQESENWQVHMHDIISELITCLSTNSVYSKQSLIEKEVRYITNYNIPLDLYKNIYASITNHFQPKEANDICKQNLNLLLNRTLDSLDTNKGQLNTFTVPNPEPVITMANGGSLSKEQIAAVKSTEPLILVQAGAGTGKSTLILSRIEYLTKCGINANDITVLSFTNAAADHILEKNADVNSMTIARMIHEIYTTNFTDSTGNPKHELSQLETIINSLDIYYPADMMNAQSVPYQFSRRLHAMVKNDNNNFTDMNNFIEDHYDEIISILDTIHQTSLELEIIICYQKIDSFIEPPTIQSKFLIIDEVQDNSVFEFVYTLKYIDKHKENLFIVGDCSQTLYEFRASNPRALNILEGSGTFTTFQLSTNYRSNQEILDMANVLLNNIEANQYANIQLKANSRAQVTEQSFLSKVHFDYVQLTKISDFHDALPSIFARDVKPYIDACIKRGEQVAILAFTRRDINKIKSILMAQYPAMNPETDIISLIPDRMHNVTIMSKFIKSYWNTVKFAPSSNIANVIIREIMAKLPNLTFNAQNPMTVTNIQNILLHWQMEDGPKIAQWHHEFVQGQITQDQMLNFIKESMIQYEIKTNGIKQALLSAKNQQNKQNNSQSNAKFLLSTIHSAKGLEFQNTIVLYRNESNMDEEKKRMYYVAFTRAMQSEFILAYDTMVSPQIQTDYVTVLETLHAKAPAPNSPLNRRPKNHRIKI